MHHTKSKTMQDPSLSLIPNLTKTRLTRLTRITRATLATSSTSLTTSSLATSTIYMSRTNPLPILLAKSEHRRQLKKKKLSWPPPQPSCQLPRAPPTQPPWWPCPWSPPTTQNTGRMVNNCQSWEMANFLFRYQCKRYKHIWDVCLDFWPQKTSGQWDFGSGSGIVQASHIYEH